MRTIVANTAYVGEPVETFLDRRDLFCDLGYVYDTAVEPEHGRAISFLNPERNPTGHRAR